MRKYTNFYNNNPRQILPTRQELANTNRAYFKGVRLFFTAMGRIQSATSGIGA